MVQRWCGVCKSWYETEAEHVCLGGPDEGHVFRFEVSSQMSSRVVGEEHHTDADWFGPPHVLHVRGWSLKQAMEKAVALPFSAWSTWSQLTGEDDENPHEYQGEDGQWHE